LRPNYKLGQEGSTIVGSKSTLFTLNAGEEEEASLGTTVPGEPGSYELAVAAEVYTTKQHDETVHSDIAHQLDKVDIVAIEISPEFGLGTHLEKGFHLFWGVFQQTSGIPWLAIFKYFPAIIFTITILSVFILARRQGFGWEAALFTCLIPTTVGILGPGFLVPMAISLLFIPLSLFLTFNFGTVWSYLVLLIFTCFLLSTHPVTAVILVIILTPYILLNVKGNFRHSLGITLALSTPFLIVFPWIFSLLVLTIQKYLGIQPLLTYVDLPRIMRLYGYLPLLLSLTGTLLLGLRGGKKNYGFILGLLALLLVLVSFFTLHYGVAIIYYRGLMSMMLMLGLIAGAGLMAIKNLKLPVWLTSRIRMPFLTKNIGYILCCILIGLTLAIGIPSRQTIPYYHMIDNQDYESFIWIRENVDASYRKAILDPWKATAFTAIAERNIYARIHAYPKPKDMESYEFLDNGCSDTAFLRENGITIIYTRGECNNPDLIEVGENIYLLEELEKDG